MEDPNIFAKCSCGWNENKTRYCDLLPGDQEWVKVRELFKTYFEATKVNCNTEARWEQCSDPKLYNEWMCAKLKAENYAYLIDDGKLNCTENLYAHIPVFKDITKYCDSFACLSRMSVSVGLIMAIAIMYISS
jgi:hypothetical protein